MSRVVLFVSGEADKAVTTFALDDFKCTSPLTTVGLVSVEVSGEEVSVRGEDVRAMEDVVSGREVDTCGCEGGG